ncbi:hypothetical protein [Enterococcus sp. DIV0187]|uniref:hypothetical protein n=1 Tax=Enterococcus sp. DIV0187 TaxID=2774644 RepID=UPI003F1FFC05
MKKRKFSKLLVVTTLCCMTFAPIAVNAATWNGVAGVSDSLVNSITQFENEAASYDDEINQLTWSINQNQGMIDTWTQNLKYATDPSSPYHQVWKGREAECQQAIDNNRGPMMQRIAQRSALQQRKNAALANAQNARSQADAQAAQIKAEANKPKPEPAPNPEPAPVPKPEPTQPSDETKPSEPAKPVQPESSTSDSSSAGTSDSSSKESSESSTSESSESNNEKDDEENKDKDKEKPEKPSEAKDPNDTVIEKEDEIKDEINDFDHNKNVKDFITKNDNGSYTASEDALKRAILDTINKYRGIYDLDAVKQSDELVDYAVNKAKDAKEQMPLGFSGHYDSKESSDAYYKALESLRIKHKNIGYLKNDLASFQSDFNTREYESQEDALESINKIAEGIVGPYGGFLSDEHMYDILNPFAWSAHVELVSSQETYTDVWTGQEKSTTVWYLAYVYSATTEN